MSYILVTGMNPSLMEEKVASYIGAGYLPLGGVATDRSGYCQAMWKESQCTITNQYNLPFMEGVQ